MCVQKKKKKITWTIHTISSESLVTDTIIGTLCVVARGVVVTAVIPSVTLVDICIYETQKNGNLQNRQKNICVAYNKKFLPEQLTPSPPNPLLQKQS